ncbi:unnamed protein product [Sphagnum compactum]
MGLCNMSLDLLLIPRELQVFLSKSVVEANCSITRFLFSIFFTYGFYIPAAGLFLQWLFVSAMKQDAAESAKLEIWMNTFSFLLHMLHVCVLCSRSLFVCLAITKQEKEGEEDSEEEEDEDEEEDVEEEETELDMELGLLRPMTDTEITYLAKELWYAYTTSMQIYFRTINQEHVYIEFECCVALLCSGEKSHDEMLPIVTALFQLDHPELIAGFRFFFET